VLVLHGIAEYGHHALLGGDPDPSEGGEDAMRVHVLDPAVELAQFVGEVEGAQPVGFVLHVLPPSAFEFLSEECESLFDDEGFGFRLALGVEEGQRLKFGSRFGDSGL